MPPATPRASARRSALQGSRSAVADRCWTAGCVRGLALGRSVVGRVGLSLALALASPVFAADPGQVRASEYEVKAAFLLNFARFVEWPADAFKSADAPIVFGVLGDDPFGPILDSTVQGKRVGRRPLVVRRLERAQDGDHCHMVFITASERPRVGQLLREVGGRGVLTVGETDRFVEQGGVIQITTEAKQSRLAVNTAAASRAGLKISAKLLSIARLVSEGRDLP